MAMLPSEARRTYARVDPPKISTNRRPRQLTWPYSLLQFSIGSLASRRSRGGPATMTATTPSPGLCMELMAGLSTEQRGPWMRGRVITGGVMVQLGAPSTAGWFGSVTDRWVTREATHATTYTCAQASRSPLFWVNRRTHKHRPAPASMATGPRGATGECSPLG